MGSYDDLFAQCMKDSNVRAKGGGSSEPGVSRRIPNPVDAVSLSEESSDVSATSSTHDDASSNFASDDEVMMSSDEDGIEREPSKTALQDMTAQQSRGVPRPSSGRNRRSYSNAMQPRSGKPVSSEDKAQPKSVLVSRSAVMRIRSMVPSLRRDSDAVDACLYMLFGCEDVSSEAKAAASELQSVLGRDDPNALNADILKQLRQITALSKRNERLLREMELAGLFLLADRLNYDLGEVRTPSQVDFLWPQYDLLYRRLSAQSRQFQKDQDAIDGRELYEAKSNGREIKP